MEDGMAEDRAERIVLGVGRETTVKAVAWTIARARRRRADVRLVRAFDPLRSTEHAEHALLDGVRDRIVAAAPRTIVSAVLSTDPIADALLHAVSEADLLVIGARRHRPIRSLITGDVPLTIAARAACATVVVADDAILRDRGPVVVGVPSDGPADAALVFAAHEADTLGAELVAVHGWTATQLSLEGGLVPPSLAADRTRHRRILDDAVARIESVGPHSPVRLVLDRQIAAWLIDDTSRDAQLVVLGTHRRGPLAGLMLGSTARELLQLSRTPVCMVPPDHSPTSGTSH